MSILSLGRFILKDGGPIGSYWSAPDGVTGLIDAVPPTQDADPAVNYAWMLSETPLDSSVLIYQLMDSGNVTEQFIDETGRQAWQATTGFRPTADTFAKCIAQHLTFGSDPTGSDFTKPLTAGKDRQLTIYLGDTTPIWDYTITGLSDPIAMPVMRVEAEGLAQIYRDNAATDPESILYRKGMGGLSRKYNLQHPVKDLLQLLMRAGQIQAGRDDLPLLDELSPNTVKSETWPTLGVITSNQDQSWSQVNGVFTVAPTGTLSDVSVSVVEIALLGYTFGGSDRIGQWIINSTGSTGSCIMGVMVRSDATGANGYVFWQNGSAAQSYKYVSGTPTLLNSTSSASVVGYAFYASAIGSTLVYKTNGIQRNSGTDTSISTGTRSTIIAFHSSGAVGSMQGPLSLDDNISSGGPFPHYTSRRMRGGFIGMNGGV